MKTAFNMDNPFFALMGKIADYVILNILFLLTSCPLITIGASLCAMHEVLPKMAQGTEGTLYRTYFRAFAQHFRRSLPVSVFLLLTGIVLVFDVTIAPAAIGEDLMKLTMPVAGGLLILWLLIFSWVFAAEDGIGKGLGKTLQKALVTAVRKLPQSLLMIVIEIFPVVCYQLFVQFFMGILMPIYICIGFSGSAALCSILAGRTKIGKKDETKYDE